MVEEEEEKEDIQDNKKEKKEQKENKEKNKNEVNDKTENKDEALELKDRLLRLAAEFDNYKKRTSKDVENSKILGKIEFASKILPIVDEFELAIDAMKINSESEKGVAMVFSNLIEALKKEGIKEIDAKGQFDPYKHEIMLSKNSDLPHGTIIQIVRKGYTINGIMIRPVSVIISNGEKDTQEKEKNQNIK